MAWKAGEKMGAKRSIGMMLSVMRYRAKEINKRSTFSVKESGKSSIDAWNHDLVYVDRPVVNDGCAASLADFLLPMQLTPLDQAIANDFINALTEEERTFCDDLAAGYSLKEILQRNHFENYRMITIQQSLREKAVAYLI
jgi:hypothetical protein